jgi:3-oxoacyl-[acyl-carrier protein] reductase
VALVTGVSRRIGIGAHVARRLRADGAALLATGWPPHDAEMPWGEDPGGEEALIDALGGPGDDLHYLRADLEDPETPRALLEEARARWGRIDVVVANHARSSQQGLADLTVEELDRCWAANARASLLLARELFALRPPGPGGRLVLFCSAQHIGPMASELPYAVTKGAIHQMTASLADALIDRGVTVNCVNPGPVDTGYAAGHLHRRIAAMFPAGRWGQPEDVARLVAWLACDEAHWITGQVIDSEGGFRRWARPRIDGD